jgi:hypothetical protein
MHFNAKWRLLKVFVLCLFSCIQSQVFDRINNRVVSEDWMEVGHITVSRHWDMFHTRSTNWVSPLVLMGVKVGPSDHFSIAPMVRNVAITAEGRVSFEGKVSEYYVIMSA